MLSKEDIDRAAAEALPQIMARFKTELEEAAISQAKGVIRSEVGKFVREWVASEVIPELHKALVESKEGIISCAPAFAGQLSDALVKAMADAAKENLQSSYRRKELLQKLFQ